MARVHVSDKDDDLVLFVVILHGSHNGSTSIFVEFVLVDACLARKFLLMAHVNMQKKL